MGQNQIKSSVHIQKQARDLLDRFTSRFSHTSQLKSLTYEQFVREMQLLNEIMDELTKSSNKTVSFSIENSSQKNFMWKLFTKIVCEKVMRNSGRVTSTKTLSVKRFIRLYADIMHQISAAAAASTQQIEDDDSNSERSQLCASMIIDGIDDSPALAADSEADNECCICMERDCQLILPCTHGYCEQCIKEWSETDRATRLQDKQNTCPLCRGPLEDASHHWVVPEPSVASPVQAEMPSLVLGLVDQIEGGTSSDPSGEDVDEMLVTTDTSDGYTLVSHNSTSPPT